MKRSAAFEHQHQPLTVNCTSPLTRTDPLFSKYNG